MPIASVGIPIRRSRAARGLANPVTLCDGHGVFFVAASGQILALEDDLAAERALTARLQERLAGQDRQEQELGS